MLSSLIFFPILSSLIVFLINKIINSDKTIKILALFFSLFELLLALYLYHSYQIHHSYYQFVEKYMWINTLKSRYFIGIDGTSLCFILLTAILIPCCILISWKSVKNIGTFSALLLLLEGLVIGFFSSLDLLLFYIFFEAVLIPMFFIIGKWGGENRIYATFKFFLYTFCGSLFMLIGIIYIIFIC